MRKQRIELPEDDGLVPVPAGTVNGHKQFRLVTPDKAHARARRIMEGFDDLPPAERYAWNYARTTHAFNPSGSPTNNNFTAKAIKAAGTNALLDEIGL